MFHSQKSYGDKANVVATDFVNAYFSNCYENLLKKIYTSYILKGLRLSDKIK